MFFLNVCSYAYISGCRAKLPVLAASEAAQPDRLMLKMQFSQLRLGLGLGAPLRLQSRAISPWSYISEHICVNKHI